jgi:hypothetical protein
VRRKGPGLLLFARNAQLEGSECLSSNDSDGTPVSRHFDFNASRHLGGMRGYGWLSAAAVLVASARTALALPALQPVHRIQLRGGQGADASSLTDNSEYAVDSRALKLLRQTNIAPK